MREDLRTAPDANASFFYGAENQSFETQIDAIAGHDPKLKELFRKVQARYQSASAKHNDASRE